MGIGPCAFVDGVIKSTLLKGLYPLPSSIMYRALPHAVKNLGQEPMLQCQRMKNIHVYLAMHIEKTLERSSGKSGQNLHVIGHPHDAEHRRKYLLWGRVNALSEPRMFVRPLVLSLLNPRLSSLARRRRCAPSTPKLWRPRTHVLVLNG